MRINEIKTKELFVYGRFHSLDQIKLTSAKKFTTSKCINLLNRLRNQEGSAIVEFVVLGLPLFLPLFIFLSGVTQISSDQRIVQSLARQVARAFVTAPDEISARSRVEMIKSIYQSKYFQSSNSNVRGIEISLNCSANPCLTMDSKVSVTASLNSGSGNRKYFSTATEIVDKWRNSN